MRIVCMALVAALGLAGCISAPTKTVNWIVDSSHAGLAAEEARGGWSAGRVSVRMPYDNQRIAVLRSDGSVAFDPVNTFAATPSKLVRGLLEDMYPGDGEALDVNVTMFALDCRDGKRMATVSVIVSSAAGTVGAGLRPARQTTATATRSAADGNYSKAFSEAAAEAISKAAKSR